jgi:hypothetical protein
MESAYLNTTLHGHCPLLYRNSGVTNPFQPPLIKRIVVSDGGLRRVGVFSGYLSVTDIVPSWFVYLITETIETSLDESESAVTTAAVADLLGRSGSITVDPPYPSRYNRIVGEHTAV